MSEEVTTEYSAPPIGAPADDLIDNRRLRWFELALVLLISFGSFLSSIVYMMKLSKSGSPFPAYDWGLGLVHEAGSLLLLGYVLSRRNLTFKDIGLRWSWRDVAMGLGVAFVSYISYSMGYGIVHFVHQAIFHASSGTISARQVIGHPSMIAIPFIFLNPFFEELIVRAFLMTEIKALTNSWVVAAGLSVALQTSYHLYYGWQGALSLGFQFLVFALYYARTRKATPIIVAHALFDLAGLVQAW